MITVIRVYVTLKKDPHNPRYVAPNKDHAVRHQTRTEMCDIDKRTTVIRAVWQQTRAIIIHVVWRQTRIRLYDIERELP